MSESTRDVLVVVGCCMALFWPGSLNFGFPGVMAPIWQEMFHVGHGAISNAIFFMLAAVGIFMFVAGRLQERYGTRAMIASGIVLCSLSAVIVAYVSSLIMLYAWSFLNGLSACFVYIPALTTVQRWYPQKKGLVTGIASMVFGLSAAVMSPIFGQMLTSFGYVSMNISIAVLTLVIGLAGAYLAISPEKMPGEKRQSSAGQSSDGKSSPSKPTATAGGKESFTVQETIRTRSFWFLWMTWAMQGAAGIAMVTLSTGYGLSKGFALGSAIVILTAFNTTNGLGRIVSGYLSDIFGRNMVMSITFFAAGIAYFLLPHASSLMLCALLAAVIGLAFGTLFSVSAPLVTECFGFRHFGAIFGLVFTGYGFIAGLLGPSLSGYLLDITGGNFFVVFLYLAIFCLLSGVLIQRVVPQIKS